MILLDITRMGGNRVCIAGVFNNPQDELENIRPAAKFGFIDREFIERKNIRPFSMVRFRFTEASEYQPHVEDHLFDLKDDAAARVVGEISEDRRQGFLDRISKDSLGGIFGENLRQNRFIYECEPGRSLGCLKMGGYDNVYLHKRKVNDDDREKLSIRIAFRQGEERLSLPIVDLELNRRICENDDVDAADHCRKELYNALRKAERIYLRVGLARPFRSSDDIDEDKRMKCYAQALGIHSFNASF